MFSGTNVAELEIFSLSLRKNNELMADLNRLKVVLCEKKRTSKWLADTLDVNPSTVSKWCTNSSQPDLGTLMKITKLLEVDVNELLRFQDIEGIPLQNNRETIKPEFNHES